MKDNDHKPMPPLPKIPSGSRDNPLGREVRKIDLTIKVLTQIKEGLDNKPDLSSKNKKSDKVLKFDIKPKYLEISHIVSEILSKSHKATDISAIENDIQIGFSGKNKFSNEFVRINKETGLIRVNCSEKTIDSLIKSYEKKRDGMESTIKAIDEIKNNANPTQKDHQKAMKDQLSLLIKPDFSQKLGIKREKTINFSNKAQAAYDLLYETAQGIKGEKSNNASKGNEFSVEYNKKYKAVISLIPDQTNPKEGSISVKIVPKSPAELKEQSSSKTSALSKIREKLFNTVSKKPQLDRSSKGR